MKEMVKILGKILSFEDGKTEIDRQNQRLEKYKECFSTEAGQFVLADLLAQCERRPYVPGSSMPFHDVTFNIGAKSVVDEIVNTVDFCDQAILKLNQVKTEILNYERKQQSNAASGITSVNPQSGNRPLL